MSKMSHRAVLGPKRRHGLVLQGVDEFVGKRLRRHVHDAPLRVGRSELCCAMACIKWVLPSPTPP